MPFLDLGGEGGIARTFERTQPVRLEALSVPDPLHGAQQAPDRAATARPVQCVTSPGGSEQVSASTSATVSVEWGGVTGGRVLSRSRSSTPASAYRRCQRHTAGRLTPAGRCPGYSGARPKAGRCGRARCARGNGSGRWRSQPNVPRQSDKGAHIPSEPWPRLALLDPDVNSHVRVSVLARIARICLHPVLFYPK